MSKSDIVAGRRPCRLAVEEAVESTGVNRRKHVENLLDANRRLFDSSHKTSDTFSS